MDTYFDVVPKDTVYIILSKLKYINLVGVTELYNIELDIKLYKQLFRIRNEPLYKQILLIFNRSYYFYLGDTIYQILYSDSFKPGKLRLYGSRNIIELYDYEDFSDISINIVRSIRMKLSTGYLFYSLDTIPKYKAAPDVIYTLFTDPNVRVNNLSSMRSFYHFIKTGEIGSTIIFSKDFWSTDTAMFELVVLYILIKLKRPGIKIPRQRKEWIEDLENGYYVGTDDNLIQLHTNYLDFFDNEVVGYIRSMKDKINYED